MAKIASLWQKFQNENTAKVGCYMSVAPLRCMVGSIDVETIQRRLAWQLCKDDTRRLSNGWPTVAQGELQVKQTCERPADSSQKEKGAFLDVHQVI